MKNCPLNWKRLCQIGFLFLFLFGCKKENTSTNAPVKQEDDKSASAPKESSQKSALFKAYAQKKLDSAIKSRTSSALVQNRASKLVVTNTTTDEENWENLINDEMDDEDDGDNTYNDASAESTYTDFNDFKNSSFRSYFDDLDDNTLLSYFGRGGNYNATNYTLTLRRTAPYPVRPTSVSIEIPVKYIQLGIHDQNSSSYDTRFSEGTVTYPASSNDDDYVYLTGTHGDCSRSNLDVNVYSKYNGDGDFSTTIIETVAKLTTTNNQVSIAVQVAGNFEILSGYSMTQQEISTASQTASYYTTAHDVTGQFRWKDGFPVNSNGVPQFTVYFNSVWHP